MVSLQTTISQDLSKKRKWEEIKAEEISEKPQQAKTLISLFDTKLEHESPLPLEWQRCLDIKSGCIYFYNTRTQKRTSKDPRLSPEPRSPDHMNLDLQLNLPCGSSMVDNFTKRNSVSNSSYSGGDHTKIKRSGIARSLSWLTFDGDQQEMFTAVCNKCHMLVMMCKSSPSCPNCKFINPTPDLSTPIYSVQEKANGQAGKISLI